MCIMRSHIIIIFTRPMNRKNPLSKTRTRPFFHYFLYGTPERTKSTILVNYIFMSSEVTRYLCERNSLIIKALFKQKSLVWFVNIILLNVFNTMFNWVYKTSQTASVMNWSNDLVTMDTNWQEGKVSGINFEFFPNAYDFCVNTRHQYDYMRYLNNGTFVVLGILL